jgi:hypothetical protein
VRSVVLAAIELDRDAVRGPEAVDGPGAEGFVSQRQLDVVLDEQQPEAALEVAAGFAVAGGVSFERGAEVRAARVAPAEGAEDVDGAGVVVELGLRERAEESALVIAGGEVQEGARDRGGGEAGTR